MWSRNGDWGAITASSSEDFWEDFKPVICWVGLGWTGNQFMPHQEVINKI